MSPAGPAPTIPTCVRAVCMMGPRAGRGSRGEVRVAGHSMLPRGEVMRLSHWRCGLTRHAASCRGPAAPPRGRKAMARFCSLQEAVQDAVHDGDVVAMEGFTHLIPFAAGHEVIRQGRRGLTLVRMTPDLIYDQLIGA